MIENECLKYLLQWPCSGEYSLSEATSAVPEDYIGRCAVDLGSGRVVVFPNYVEAAKASRLAVNLLIGGYSSATVIAADVDQQITHETADDWAFN